MDSNGVNPVAEWPGAYEAVRAALESGSLDLLYTRLIWDEVAATPDAAKRSRLLRVLSLGRCVASGAFAFDLTPLDDTRFGDESAHALKTRGRGKTKDAVVGATAAMERCALVTEDKELSARVRAQGGEVLTPRALLAELGFDIDGT